MRIIGNVLFFTVTRKISMFLKSEVSNSANYQVPLFDDNTAASTIISHWTSFGSVLSTVAWYRCTTPVLFCGHRRSPPLLESCLIPMYNARFILWPSSLSSPIRKKLVNGQMPEMWSQPLKQSLCLATQSQLGQSIATNREIRSEKFQNFISIFRELFALDSHW